MFERYIETEEYVTLPMAAGLYRLNISGTILDHNGNIVHPKLDELSNLVVWLDWINGYAFYRLVELIAFTFKTPKLSSKYWGQLRVVFKDGNIKNIHPSNLVWKFPIGLGSTEYFGFAFIPMFSRYVINREGVVYEKLKNRIVKAHFNKGYYSYSLKPDVGPRTSLKRHRGMCLAFTDYPSNVDDLQVNHKNGIVGDDWLENLEWVTGSENRLHAIQNGLTLVNKPVIMRNIETSEIIEFNTLGDFCKKLNLNQSKMSKLLANPEEPLVHEGFEISYKNKEHAILENTNKRPILVRDIRTTVVKEYDSIANCSSELGITKHIVNWRINTPTSCLHADYRQFKRKSDLTPWYSPEDYEWELLENSWSKVTLVKNCSTGVVKEYSTQRIAASDLGIAESTIYQWLSSVNQPIFRSPKDGSLIQVKNKSDRSDWRISENPSGELDCRSQTKTVLVRDVKTGVVQEYISAKTCADAIGVTPTNLNWRLKSNGQKVYSKKWQFKYKSEPTAFLEIILSESDTASDCSL